MSPCCPTYVPPLHSNGHSISSVLTESSLTVSDANIHLGLRITRWDWRSSNQGDLLTSITHSAIRTHFPTCGSYLIWCSVKWMEPETSLSGESREQRGGYSSSIFNHNLRLSPDQLHSVSTSAHKIFPGALVTTHRYCAAEANILRKLIGLFPVKWQFPHYVDIWSCSSCCPQERFAIASYKQHSTETGSDVIERSIKFYGKNWAQVQMTQNALVGKWSFNNKREIRIQKFMKRKINKEEHKHKQKQENRSRKQGRSD